MITVTVREDESIDSALSRFNKICAKAGIIREVRERSYYEKPSEKKRRLEKKRQRKSASISTGARKR
jgi:small subunit ribosomal protein S21